MTLLTIEDKILHNFAIVEPRSREIVWISGALFRAALTQLLKEPAQIREEKFDFANDKIIMYLRGVALGEPDFPEALRQTLERQGLEAQLVDEGAAKLQMILRQSFLSKDLQNKIVYNLRRLTDPQISEILTELRSV